MNSPIKTEILRRLKLAEESYTKIRETQKQRSLTEFELGILHEDLAIQNLCKSLLRLI